MYVAFVLNNLIQQDIYKIKILIQDEYHMSDLPHPPICRSPQHFSQNVSYMIVFVLTNHT